MTDGITQEQYDTLVELSKKPELIMTPEEYYAVYQGIDKESNKEDIETIESILKQLMPELSSFCNFTPVNKSTIRVLTYYDESFIGVHYIYFKDLKECIVAGSEKGKQDERRN